LFKKYDNYSVTMMSYVMIFTYGNFYKETYIL